MISLTAITCAGHGSNPKTTGPDSGTFTGAKGEVRLMILDPGHFHAALIQKTMLEQIDTNVHVFAPEGADVQDHLTLINRYNLRETDPTRWNEIVYTGPDYLDKMLTEKPGNVMVVSGNNAKKTEYIKKAIDAGINVLADKPMVISPEKFSIQQPRPNETKQQFHTNHPKGPDTRFPSPKSRRHPCAL
ncbi:MAG: Gfo/Idh/MocA family oxidoreductase, partial [Bacteroidales bacterium]|nr:Gfo/Idh/MocA family oxidoreductase [Bacteroidales bacterium]